MLDDQAMAQQWIIRVQGKEYGPVDVETLREWKTEGRLLPGNEARRADSDVWATAADIPNLFNLGEAVPTSARRPTQPSLPAPRSLAQILAETLRIYRKGFPQFFGLVLIVAAPSICAQLANSTLGASSDVELNFRTLIVAAFGLCMLLLSLATWPVFVAGIQILTAELSTGREARLFKLFPHILKFWPRVAMLCIFVYGIFLVLTVFAFGITAMIMAGGSSLLVPFLALALLGVQVWMFGRFFINVLFWQQFAVLENAGVVESLSQSRNLARSGRNLPWFQRPLWRGVLIASIWFAFVLVLQIGAEWHTIQQYFHELTTTQDPQALLQKITESQRAHGFDLFSFSLNVLQRILQPLLGIAFVLLYFDSKAASGMDSSRREIDTSA
jgi:GYF domain 2